MTENEREEIINDNPTITDDGDDKIIETHDDAGGLFPVKDDSPDDD